MFRKEDIVQIERRGASVKTVEEHIETEISGHLLHLAAHMPYADYTESASVKLYGLPCSDPVKRGKDILHHATGIAALCIMHKNTLSPAIVKVYMVKPDCSRGYHFHIRPFKQFLAAPCPRPYDKHVRINDIFT